MREPGWQGALFGGFSLQVQGRGRGKQQGGEGGRPAEGTLADGVAGSHAHLVQPPGRQAANFGAGAQAPPGLLPVMSLLRYLQPACMPPQLIASLELCQGKRASLLCPSSLLLWHE